MFSQLRKPTPLVQVSMLTGLTSKPLSLHSHSLGDHFYPVPSKEQIFRFEKLSIRMPDGRGEECFELVLSGRFFVTDWVDYCIVVLNSSQ
jgi:hypothetical protein